MANIGHIIICEEVLERQDNKLAIVGPLSMIVLDAIPNNYTFTASIAIFDIEPRIVYEFSVKVYSPSSEELWGFNGDFDTQADAGWHSTIMNIPFRNFKFTSEGSYMIEVTLTNKNDEKQTQTKEFNFSVRKKES
ncbi:DUF6941 family protein [Halobacillus sp. SY10]|uniref:DUF6941 family protein n=1 Tax=Halobacillus sp. SY10 TaxID=3381356 RepID=UPI003879F419